MLLTDVRPTTGQTSIPEHIVTDVIVQLLLDVVSLLQQPDRVVVILPAVDGQEFPAMDPYWVTARMTCVSFVWWLGSISLAEAQAIWAELPLSDDPGGASRVILALDGYDSTLAWVTL